MSGSQKSEFGSRKPVRRARDWPARLAAAVAARAEAPFAWGAHDCAIGAAFLIEAMTGWRPPAALARYTTARGARFRMAKYGGLGAIAASVCERCAWSEVAPGFAQRGDLVLIQGDKTDPQCGTDQALGVIGLEGRFALVADIEGWAQIPVPRVVKAWRIG